jgi:hypothetical protein
MQRPQYVCIHGVTSKSGQGKGVVVPDIVNLIVWLIAGVTGWGAAGELLKGET